jgi:hypothetical protein
MQNIENTTWLCRNCNTLVDNNLNMCPSCSALRPEIDDDVEPTPEGIAEEVHMENYTNAGPKPKAKYNFRESVLTTVADIFLALGLLLVIGSFIAPHVIELPYPPHTALMGAICIALLILAITMTTWALLRTVADISRRTREMHERE